MASEAGSWLKQLDIDSRGWILVQKAVFWLLRMDLSFGGQILAPETDFGFRGWIMASYWL